MEQNQQNLQNNNCGVEARQPAASVGEPVGEPTLRKTVLMVLQVL